MPPEVGREPRGSRSFSCIAWFASIDAISNCDIDQHHVDRCVCLPLKSSTPRGRARFSKGDMMKNTQFLQFQNSTHQDFCLKNTSVEPIKKQLRCTSYPGTHYGSTSNAIFSKILFHFFNFFIFS